MRLPTAGIGARRPKDARKYRTQCKNCGEALYGDEAAVWQSATPIGLIHERCAP